MVLKADTGGHKITPFATDGGAISNNNPLEICVLAI